MCKERTQGALNYTSHTPLLLYTMRKENVKELGWLICFRITGKMQTAEEINPSILILRNSMLRAGYIALRAFFNTWTLLSFTAAGCAKVARHLLILQFLKFLILATSIFETKRKQSCSTWKYRRTDMTKLKVAFRSVGWIRLKIRSHV